jgi:hypothetical protein
MRIRATVEGLKRWQIHGERYVTVYYSHDDERDTIRHAQLGEDALPAGLRVGEHVTVEYIVNVVTGVERTADG